MLRIKRKYPEFAISFDVRGLTAVKTKNGNYKNASVCFEPFGKDIFAPDFTKKNVNDEKALSNIIRSVLDHLNISRGSRVSLVLPDSVFRVFHFTFDDIPTRTHDLEDLFKFRLRKIIPFDADSAVISSQSVHNKSGKQTFLVGVTYKPVIEQYEKLFESFGLHCGLIDKKSNNLVNLYEMNSNASERLILHVIIDRTHLSILLADRGEYLLYRGKTLNRKNVKQVLQRETLQSVMYWFDRLGGNEMPEAVIHENGYSFKPDAIKFDKGKIEFKHSNLADELRRLRYIATNDEMLDKEMLLAPLAAAIRSYM